MLSTRNTCVDCIGKPQPNWTVVSVFKSPADGSRLDLEDSSRLFGSLHPWEASDLRSYWTSKNSSLDSRSSTFVDIVAMGIGLARSLEYDQVRM